MKPNDFAQWKVNTPQLLKEILASNETQILKYPLQIFSLVLAEVSQRCLELNDPILNGLMCRLALYEQSDPYSKEFNQAMTDYTIDEYKKQIILKKESNENNPHQSCPNYK